MKSLTEHMTIEQAATKLGLSRQRVQQFVTKGRLPSIKMGGVHLIPRAAVARFSRLPRKNGAPFRTVRRPAR